MFNDDAVTIDSWESLSKVLKLRYVKVKSKPSQPHMLLTNYSRNALTNLRLISTSYTY